jgi:hypothetical protein
VGVRVIVCWRQKEKQRRIYNLVNRDRMG